MLQDGTISVRNLSCRSRSIRSRRITFVFPFSLVIGSVNATMNRSSFVLLGAAALAACVDLGVQHGVASLSIQPVLDSVFVGDRTLAHRVTSFDEHGNAQPAGTGVWTSTDRTIATATPGGPSRYIVHADSLADTGAVYVMSLSDTTGGKMFFSVGCTVVTHVGGSAVAVNYRATSGKLAFQLLGRVAPSGSTTQRVEITLPDSVISADTTFAIDSLNPGEDQTSSHGFVAECSPPRPWAFWLAPNRIVSYSRRGGTLGVLRIVPIPNGQAVSGHFSFTTQRTDLYTDPLGELSVTGSFVVPLVTSTTVCH